MKTVQNQAKPVSKQTWRNKVTYVKKNWQLYLFFLMPGLLLTIIFKYLPMGGLLIAFEDYNVIKGVLGSPWVGLEYFRRFLSSPDFMNYLMNTLKLSIYGLLWGFPVPIILALLMNRIQKTGIKKKVQLLIYMPNLYLHYYSEMLTQLLSSYSDYHYKFLVFSSEHEAEEEQQYIEELLSYQIEGLIVLSHTLSSKQLSSYQIPIVAIEREAEYISSVTTDNYMGALQATTLLIRDKCDILIHINVNVEKTVPAYDRIRAFKETCEEYQVPYDIDLSVSGNSYQEILNEIRRIFTRIEEKYPNQKKGIFLSNDTYANMFLNLIFQKYRELPSFYEIIGFDNSPIASEAILPITTVGQQIDIIAQTAMELLVQQMEEQKKRSPKPLEKPVHKQITPILIRRNTTS